MEINNWLQLMSPLLLVLVYITTNVETHSHHIRHLSHRDRFKRQQGEHLYLPGSYVSDSNDPDAGPWLEWSSPSPCSRTCGGGVSTQFRTCTEGYRCQGSSKKHFSCNTQDCDDNSDYRAQQCAEFDAIPYEGITYQWVPYTNSPNQCELNCMPRGGRFYYRHRLHVADGTKCNQEKLDVCVEGTCQPVGCDMMLGSNVREDKCRVCGGDGSTCNTITGLIDQQDLQQGYNDIILIPAGATNIDVREREPSNNYLAVRNTLGQYHLNGNWRVDFSKTVEFSGCKFHYNRNEYRFSALDSITCQGPINETIFIVLLFENNNVGVEYEYSLPKDRVELPPNETYAWTFDQFTPCTSSCGGGIQYRNVSCASRNSLEPAASNLCDPTNRPSESQRCGEVPCNAQWVAKPWGKCSAPCGVGGSQTRQILCEQVITNGIASIIGDEHCNNIQKPPSEQPCNQGEICSEWHTGPWKPCDHLCGDGKETRVVTCFRKVDGKIQKLDDSECAEQKPETEKPCNLRPCEGTDWVTSDWSGCDKCGLSSETRRVQCATAKGDVYPDDLCSDEDKPETERECTTKSSGCDYEWYASQWSECSAKCGKGVKTRKVFCAAIEDLQKAGDEKCDESKKYEATMECEAEQETCTGEWFSGPWSKCSKECGGGDKTRKIICMRDNETVAATECGPDTIPSGSESCNTQACDKDEVLPVDVTKPVDVTDEADKTAETKEYTDVTSDMDLTTEASLETSTDDDYEIVESDECDDGEWVDDDEEDEEEEGTSPMEGSEATEESTPFGSSTVSSQTDESTDSSLATDDLMLSDTTGTGDETESTASMSLDTGSGEEESTGSTDSSKSDGTDEGSGDGYSLVTEEMTTSSSDVSEGASDVTDESGASGASSAVTEESGATDASGATDETGVTEIASAVTDESGATDESITTEVSGATDTSDGATESSATSDASTETSSDVTESSSSESTSEQTTDTTSESSTTDSASESTTDSNTETTTDAISSDGDSTTSASSDITDATTSDDHTNLLEADIIFTTKDSASTDETVTSDSTESTIEFTGSTESTIEFTGSTESTIEFTGSSESTVEFTGSTESTTEFTGSTESTIEFTGSTEFTTEFTGSTEPTTEFTGSTDATTEFTGSTDETTEFTGSTTEFTGSTEFDIWSSTTEGRTDWTATEITEEIFTRKPKKCKRKKRKDCKPTEYGCCPDKITPAEGPFDKGCPMPKTCKESQYGCCEDGVSAARGKKFSGCPATHCEETLFGCCKSDEKTPAEGENDEGCPPPPPKCLKSRYGCCKDNVTAAEGPKGKGCEKIKEDCAVSDFGCCPDGETAAQGEFFKGCDVNCTETRYGCCPDGKRTAEGPNFRGCKIPCAESTFGCCEDGNTPAHGYNREGCCLSSPNGCCPDNIKAADGPNLEGCGCDYSPYRCCPDNITPARGYNNEGCGCQYTEHGCCPDNYTPAAGPEYQGCLCHTFQFGCCPDGTTIAKGPHQQGCGCRNTEFGCCSDNQTPASGPSMEGCGCASSEFGCCMDGVIEAQGENFEGCEEVPINEQAGCGLSKERGPCRNYTVKWYYDTQYGGCSRFWYGGCDGNSNRYKSVEECKDTCVEPQGKARCNLPKVAGGCEGYYPQWYYDKDHNHCAQFIYGGCLGNNNRFETSEDCIKECVTDSSQDACDQPREEGPCRGQYLRWYFNKETTRCEQFYFGGCKANSNNFPTEMACAQQCAAPNRKKDHCSLPRAQGNCTSREPRWLYDVTEKRCMPFYYSGCEGNNNNFYSQEQCEADCPKDIEKDTCHLPAETGECANYTERWYFDTREKSCRQFYYGGCGGNGNNFDNEPACLKRCENVAPPPPEQPEIPETNRQPEQPPPQPPAPEEPFKRDDCFLEFDSGPCRHTNEARWYYDRDGVCKQFPYGGCEGNKNNFKTVDECKHYCGNVQDLCTLPKVVGPCDAEYDSYYYDYETDTCAQFKYGGCLGNDNRFDTIQNCEQRCKRGPPTYTEAPPKQEPPPYEQDTAICYHPVDQGNCTDNYAMYYYDINTQRCLPFTYTGCGGNANRYTSEEQCERQCGKFRGQDVCNMPRDPGPCDGYFVKSYYDTNAGRCADFAYGGCEGNGNRFSSIEECQNICVLDDERKPNNPNSEICRLSVDVGSCETAIHKRWYFDDQRGECLSFIYTGCGGNFNRFKSFDECYQTCREFINPPIDGTDIEITDPQTSCERQEHECRVMQCEYGTKMHVDESYCRVCTCHDPCENHQCYEGTQCSVDMNNNRTSENDETFIPVCRPTNKVGVCPHLLGSQQCTEECRNDADCREDLKCCSTGCGTSCVRPHSEIPADITSGSQPAYTEAPISAGYYPPQVDVELFNPEVVGNEGDFATLTCAVQGNPNPTISWRKDSLVIDGSQPRYRLKLDGTLQIITLHKTDSGIYLCTAENAVGRLQNEIRLDVRDGVGFQARVLDAPEEESTVVSLGSPASLNCYALGFPFPIVTWWKDDSMIPLKTSQYEQRKDFSLLIHRVELTDLGLYTCQAYNGVGKATSWTVTVMGLGPYYTTNPDELKYMKYIVNNPPKVEVPDYPYRPQRTSSAPAYQPTPQTYAPPPYYPEPNTVPRQPIYGVQYIVPVKTNITLKQHTAGIGSDLNIPCDVEGYPVPEVRWYKDGQPILPAENIEIIEGTRLIIRKASEADSGEYKCEAFNQYSSAYSIIRIGVEGMYIDPNCTDNQFFANCKLIVQAKYCTHKYYARFCCRSCTQAGQLPSHGPHLEQHGDASDTNLI